MSAYIHPRTKKKFKGGFIGMRFFFSKKRLRAISHLGLGGPATQRARQWRRWRRHLSRLNKSCRSVAANVLVFFLYSNLLQLVHFLFGYLLNRTVEHIGHEAGKINKTTRLKERIETCCALNKSIDLLDRDLKRKGEEKKNPRRPCVVVYCTCRAIPTSARWASLLVIIIFIITAGLHSISWNSPITRSPNLFIIKRREQHSELFFFLQKHKCWYVRNSIYHQLSIKLSSEKSVYHSRRE